MKQTLSEAGNIQNSIMQERKNISLEAYSQAMDRSLSEMFQTEQPYRKDSMEAFHASIKKDIANHINSLSKQIENLPIHEVLKKLLKKRDTYNFFVFIYFL